jgi:hypothetical protein
MEIELLGADGEVAGIGTVIQIVEWVGGLNGRRAVAAETGTNRESRGDVEIIRLGQ